MSLNPSSEPSPVITINQAYYMAFKEEDPEALKRSPLIAIRPTFWFESKTAEWGTNSSRGNSFEWKAVNIDPRRYSLPSIKNDPSSHIFVDNGPEVLEIDTDEKHLKLIRLTLEIFNTRVRPYVVNGKKLQFSSDDEVQKFFLNNDFEGF